MTSFSSFMTLGMLLIGILVAGFSSPAVAAPEAQVSLIERYQRALAVDAHNPTLLYQLGVALLVENQPDAAIENFDRAYPAYIDSIEMNYNLGLAYTKTEDPDSAVLYFEQAEALGALLQPGRFPLEDAYFNLGLMYLKKDLLREAELLLKKVLSLNPDRVEVHHALGKLYNLSGQNDKSVAEYQHYLTAKPGDQAVREFLFATYYNRGLNKLANKEYLAARADFSEALQAIPSSNRALYTLAHIDFLQGDPLAAIEKLNDIYPQADQDLRENIRVVIYNSSLKLLQRNQNNDLEFAAKAVSTLLEETPEDQNTLFLAGNIALTRKNYDQARGFYESLLDINAGHQGALTNLALARKGAVKELVSKGRTHLQELDYLSALNALETALAIDPAVPEGASLAAIALTELNKATSELFDQAEQALSKGELVNALDLSRKGLDNHPDDARGKALETKALSMLQTEIKKKLAEGDRQLEQTELALARSAFTAVLKLDVDNRSAREEIERIEHLEREQAGNLIKQANQALSRGDLLLAESVYRMALKLQPGQPDAKTGLARTLSQIDATVAGELRQFDRARESGDFSSARLHIQKALALRATKESQQKLIALKNDLNQKIEQLLIDAVKSVRQEEFKAGENLYNKVLSLAPSHSAARKGLAELEQVRADAVARYIQKASSALQAHDPATALLNFRKALQQKPTDQAALDGLEQAKSFASQRLEKLLTEANTAYDENRFAEAESTYRRVIELDPYNVVATTALDRMKNLRQEGLQAGDEQQLYLSGIQLYTKGRYQDAIALWQKVLLLTPDHEKAQLNIEKSRRKMRMIKERKQ